LALEDDSEKAQKEKEALVREIVKDLPSPCNELLWGYYGDGHSMKMLAEMFNYASENAVKVTKHRCCEKFRVKYSERVKSLF
jgi:DNA-directed RNA polymerase specialized sigma24 family protein